MCQELFLQRHMEDTFTVMSPLLLIQEMRLISFLLSCHTHKQSVNDEGSHFTLFWLQSHGSVQKNEINLWVSTLRI